MNTPPFRIGQKVVCVDNKSIPGANQGHLLSIDSVYTVCGLKIAKHGIHSGKWVVNIKEVLPDSRQFLASRFAPIEESRSRIQYVAVSESLREKAVEIAAVETN